MEKLLKKKMRTKKPYKHVFNRPEDIENRRKAQELYDEIRREYEERTGKKQIGKLNMKAIGK